MKSNVRFIRLAILFVVLTSGTEAFADVKIKTRQTSEGRGDVTENTTYIKGKRQRTESGGNAAVSLMQCDLRRSVQLSPAAKTYMVIPFGGSSGAPTTGAAGANGQAETKVVRGGTVTSTVTSKDTGERKQMFGHTARRLLTTIETKSSPDACSPHDTRMEIDAWVVDAEFALDCQDALDGFRYQPAVKGGCQDRYEMRTVGAAKSGFPLYQKTTIFYEGRPISTSVQEVVELSKVNLDAALFDVPADYREVTDSREMYASTSSGRKDAEEIISVNNSTRGAKGNSGIALGNSSASVANVSTEVGAKKAGVVRLGFAGVRTGATGEGINPTELSGAVQNTLAEYLKMPDLEIVQLEARLPSAIEAEARQKECDFVVYASVSHKKGGGGGMFGKALGRMSETVARTAVGSSNVAGQVAKVTVMGAASVSGNVKSKDQITLEIRLVAPGGSAQPVIRQFQAKARSDGEDSITPVVEQAAQAIVDAAKK